MDAAEPTALDNDVQAELDAMVDAALAAHPSLDREAAKQRVYGERARHAVLSAALSSRSGSAGYAGAFYNIMTDVMTVRSADADFSTTIRERGAAEGVNIEIDPVGFSAQRLRAVAQAITGKLANAKIPGMAGADLEENVVVVVTDKPAAAADLARAATNVPFRVSPPDRAPLIEDACISTTNCGTPLRAGMGIQRDGDGIGCSSGFGMTDKVGGKYMATAGHCLLHAIEDQQRDGQYSTNGNFIGHTINRCEFCSGHNNVDVGLVKITGNYWQETSLGWLFNYAHPDNPVGLGDSVLQDNEIIVGDIACIKGRHADEVSNKCGEVDNSSDFFHHSLVKVEGYDACPGDSGGAWITTFSNGTRFGLGIHHGSDDGCHSSGNTSWFTSLGDMLDWSDGIDSHTYYVVNR